MCAASREFILPIRSFTRFSLKCSDLEYGIGTIAPPLTSLSVTFALCCSCHYCWQAVSLAYAFWNVSDDPLGSRSREYIVLLQVSPSSLYSDSIHVRYTLFLRSFLVYATSLVLSIYRRLYTFPLCNTHPP
jgi:hypothetical protein